MLRKGDLKGYKAIPLKTIYNFIDIVFILEETLYRITEKDAEIFLDTAEKPLLIEV